MEETLTNKLAIDPWSQSVTLEGSKIRLVPLSVDHLKDLAHHLLYPNAWHSLYWNIKNKSDLEQNIQKSIKIQKEGNGNNFAMILKSTQQAVGKSHFMNIVRSHQTLEIGGTWIGKAWQKTFINTEAKKLMLGYTFEKLKCHRVEFRVDAQNFNSQKAVLRIGAKFEGDLRNAILLPDGRKRDYKLYSIIDSDWPNIKSELSIRISK